MKFISAERELRPKKYKPSQRQLGLLLGVGSVLFGGTYSALAKGLTPFLSPVALVIVSEALTALFMVMTIGVVPLIQGMKKMRSSEIFVCIIVGLLNSAIAPLLWYVGLVHTTAINASILSGADIIFTLFFGWLILSERINQMQAIGAFIVFAGVVVINLDGVSGEFAIHTGDLYVLAGVGVFSLGVIIFKRYLTHISAEVALLIRNVTGMLAMLMLSAFLTHPFMLQLSSFPIDRVLLLLAFVFFARYLNNLTFYEALDRLPATELGLMENAGPLAGVIFAVMLLGEQIQSYQMIGAFLIIIGIILEHVSKHALMRVRRRVWGMRLQRQN